VRGINERDFIPSVKYSEKFKVIANPEKPKVEVN
jgi:hypothetical protein